MVVSKGKERSLLMCTTPLQMLIAERIVDLNPDQEFDLLVFAQTDNEKYSNYYKRLSVKCVNSLYYKARPGFLSFLGFMLEFKKSKINRIYHNYYLASIDSRHIQYILSKCKHPNVFTFDDGTANIFDSSVYYLDLEPVIYKKIVWRFFGVRYYLSDIKRMSLLHYTVYKGMDNIVENLEFISLFGRALTGVSVGENISRTVKIYLGQPLQECSAQCDISYVTNHLKKIKIDLYFPHPREEVFPTGDFIIIRTELIFEDYLINYIKENSNIKIEVYSFISSAILNVRSLPNVDVKYLYDEIFSELYGEFYQYAEKNLGIECINLEKL